MAINVSEIITDPDFASTYKVFRKRGKWVGGRFETQEEELKFYGVVQPTAPKELQQIPEGERANGAISFHSTKKFYLTREPADEDDDADGYASDEIVWHGERYKILSVKDWSERGYWKAIAVLM